MDTKVPKARKIKKNCTWTNEEKRYFARMINDKISIKIIVKIYELFASLGQNAIDYAFKLTEIPKFKYLNADYTGLDEN